MASTSMMLQWKSEGKAEGLAEGMAIGMIEARRADLIKVVRVRFPDAPYELISLLKSMKDLDQLGRWFESALMAPSVEMFQAMAQDADHRALRSYR